MSTIRRITLVDLERLLEEWQPRRRITQFHLHCTGRPRRAEFRGQATVEAMRAYHMGKGWSDIAQHLTVDPAGGLWTGRAWDSPPASAFGRNGTAKAGPFMIEVVGNFDRGLDPFDGPQKDAVLGVIAAVLRKAGLTAEALFFHRDFTDAKSCPGTGVDRDALRREVAARLDGTARLVLPSVAEAALDAGEVRGWFAMAGARGADGALQDADFAEVPEAEWMLAEQEALAARLDLGPGAEGARRAPLPDDAPLRRHAVNLSKGLLSIAGDIDSVKVTPRTIVEKHLVDYIETCRLRNAPARLLFYAHGGLVDEASAICYARTVLPWWLRNGVFPVFFLWESGLFETLRQAPRAARGPGDITDWFLEGLGRPVARRVWAEMKEDAGNASMPALPQYQGRSGGAWQLAELLRPVLAKYPEVTLHAVGHSTGPIFLAKFLPLLAAHGHVISTLSYLAPAIRTDRFLADVAPLLGAGKPIRELCMYTMTDEAERDDSCAKVYRKSLLYFVREACDDQRNGRVLGLQKDLYADPALRALFGLPSRDDGRVSAQAGPVAVEFSPAPGSPRMNPKTRALRHGGFDNDAETMVSVLARVLGVPRVVGSPAMQFPSASAFEACGLEDATRAPPLLQDEGEGGCPCCGRGPGVVDGGFTDDGRDGFGDDAEAGGDAEAGSTPAAEPAPATAGAGRRVAVCVGIDAYPDQPLDGCVNDSVRWAEALSQRGFQVRSLHDAQATRQAMHDALQRLVAEARAGDRLVFQYAGHGAQLPDIAGDEDDRFDEAFVPFDYRDGQVLIDDDIRAITRGLPEGASLTLFMDCCHSGTLSRARARAASKGSRPRLMRFDREVVDRYLAVRGGRRGPARTARARASASPGPGVVHFAACLDSEYAWESDGGGDFTRAALAVFDTALDEGWSNQQFISAVVRNLGKPVRQHPRLWNPERGLGKARLLGGP